MTPADKLPDDIEKFIPIVLQNLREFGYGNCTEQFLRSEIYKALAGQQTGIIGMMARGMYEKTGYWPKEKQADA